MVTSRRGLLFAAGGALLAGGALAALRLRRSAEDSDFADLGRGLGGVSLTSADGQRISWSAMAGVPRALFFGFTHCPVICPVTIYELTAALERIAPVGGDIRVQFITVDPERDTPERLAQYFSGFGARIDAFTGDTAALGRVTTSFRVVARRTSLENGDYTMDHTATVFLLDRAGQVRDVIAYGAAPEVIDERLRALAGT